MPYGSKGDDWVVTPHYQTFRCDRILANLGNELLQAILTVVQDGICILDRELNILYVNPAMSFWFPITKDMAGAKCYAAFHNATSCCSECPSCMSFETKKPHIVEKSYDKRGMGLGWHRVYSVPVMDSRGEVALVIEYIREITPQKRAENMAEFSETQNKALIDFLEQKERERETFEQMVVNNVELCIKPILAYLENELGTDSMKIVKRQLDSVVKGLNKNNAFPASVLSPRELEIAELIRNNYASKEIAQKLSITKKAVDFHRTNIRKKLGLKPDDSLRIFLNVAM